MRKLLPLPLFLALATCQCCSPTQNAAQSAAQEKLPQLLKDLKGEDSAKRLTAIIALADHGPAAKS